MTTAPPSDRVTGLDAGDAGRLAAVLAEDFDQPTPGSAVLRHQHLLDALDNGEHHRFQVWPDPREPVGVLFNGPSGTAVVAGRVEAGPALAPAAEALGWRVLIGAAPVASALLDAAPRGLFRRRPSARIQRYMAVEGLRPARIAVPEGFRRGVHRDVEALTELACRLHVEDQMGPPISRSGREAVRNRVRDSIARGATWVVEWDGEVIGKLDVSLRSRRRGAQIVGVYVAQPARGRGIASAAVAAVTDQLLGDGLPGVTLHVREDNASAIHAYRRAGFVDRGPLVLALR